MSWLYHYTCDHGMTGIQQSDMWLKPNPAALWRLVWLTDLDVPDRDALGLTSHLLDCDRTRHRLRIKKDTAISWWPHWCRAEGITRAQRDGLELAPGARPRHWYVTPWPIRAEQGTP